MLDKLFETIKTLQARIKHHKDYFHQGGKPEARARTALIDPMLSVTAVPTKLWNGLVTCCFGEENSHFPQGIDLNATPPLRPFSRHVGGNGHVFRSTRVLADSRAK